MDSSTSKRTLRHGSFFREPTLIALQTMLAHKLRSFLMLLGIILSVSTLILVVALIAGMNGYFATRIANLGSNVFLVMKFPIISDSKELLKATRRNRDITWEDFEAMRGNLKLPKAVGVEARRTAKVRAERQNLEDVNIRGVKANIGDMDVEEVATGRYITDSDNQHRDMVCMIGADVADKLFANTDPLGKTMAIDGEEFQVVGVAKKIGNTFGQSQDNFGILGSDSLMGLWQSLTGTLASGMVGLVSIFLVIGGVVIMNVMLASVTERTREIGIRKSLVARKRDILRQFLFESTVMAVVGGALGVLIAWILSVIVRSTTPVPMAVPISAVVLAITISSAVGIFFGVYPARKAARLDPIEALRYEN